MARSAVISGGSISPFGSGGSSFSMFDIGSSSTAGGSTTVDPSEQAYLDYQKTKALWEQGQIDNGTYEAAYQAYLTAYSAAHPDTAQAIGAGATMASLKYSLDRDTLQGQVGMGNASLDDLLAFDRAAMAGLNPNSQEYYNRLSTLWSTENQVFSRDEQVMVDAVNANHMTYTQLADWYAQQGQVYGDNHGLLTALDARIKSTQASIVAEQDQKVVDAWQADTLDIKTFLAYAQSAQAGDPQSPRAIQWKKNADTAIGQVQSASLGYRYGLTDEYIQLEAFVQSGAPKMGGTRTSTRTMVDASGKLYTVSSTTATAPTAAEQAAYADYKVKLAQAQTRMKEIEKQVSAMPGGWVTNDDMIAFFQGKQAGEVKGGKQWIADQQQVDNYRSKKAAAQLLAQSGVKISFPTYTSETATDVTVPGTEKPATAKAQLALKLKGYDDKIAAYTKEMNDPATPEDRKAVLAAAIKQNQVYKSNLTTNGGKPATLPRMTAPGTAASSVSGGAGGGGTGPSAAPGTAPTSTPASPNASPSGFLRLITGATNTGIPIGTAPGGQPVFAAQGAGTTYTTRNVGIPAMTVSSFEKLYDGFVGAIRDGQTEYNDPVTGASYLLPSDPTERQAMLSSLDARNISVQSQQLQAKLAVNADDTAARAALNKAVNNQKENLLYVLDYEDAGVPAAWSVTTPTGGTLALDTKGKGGAPVQPVTKGLAAEGLAPSMYPSMGYKGTDPTPPPNALAKGLELMSTTEQAVQMYGDAATKAFAAGEVEKAYGFLAAAGRLIGDPHYGTVDGRLKDIATLSVYAQTQAQATGIPIPTNIQKDLDLLAHAAPTLDANGTIQPGWSSAIFKKYGLEDLAQQFNPDNPNGVAAVNTATGTVGLREGVQLVYKPGTNGIGPGTLVPTYLGTDAGYDPTTGKLAAAQGNQVEVLMDVDGKPTPVIVPFTIGTVGTTTTGAPLKGKLVNVQIGNTRYTLGENPMQPGQWIPLSDGHPISINLPAGVTVLQKPDARLGSTQEAQFAFTLPGNGGGNLAQPGSGGGEGYIMAMDTTTGTYTLYHDNKATGQLDFVSNLAGTSGREGVDILSRAGIALNTSGMTDDQKLWAGSGMNFVGSGQQLRDFLNAMTPAFTKAEIAVAQAGFRAGERADLSSVIRPPSGPMTKANDITGILAPPPPTPVLPPSGPMTKANDIIGLSVLPPMPLLAGKTAAVATGGLSTSQTTAARKTPTPNPVLAAAQKPVGIEQNRGIVKVTPLPVIPPPPAPSAAAVKRSVAV